MDHFLVLTLLLLQAGVILSQSPNPSEVSSNKPLVNVNGQQQQTANDSLSTTEFVSTLRKILSSLRVNREFVPRAILLCENLHTFFNRSRPFAESTLTFATLALSPIPYGSVGPTLIQVGLRIFDDEKVRRFGRHVLYQVWLDLPKSEKERLGLDLVNGDVIVVRRQSPSFNF